MWTPAQLVARTEPYEPAIARYHFHPMAPAAAPAGKRQSGTVVQRGREAWSPRSARRRAGKLLKNCVQELNQVGAGDSMRDVARRLKGLLRSDADRSEFAGLLLERMRRPDEHAFIPRYGELVRRLSGEILENVTRATVQRLSSLTIRTDSLHLYLFAVELTSESVHQLVVSALRECTDIAHVRDLWEVYRKRPRYPPSVPAVVRQIATRLAAGPPSRTSILAYDVLTTIPPEDDRPPAARRKRRQRNVSRRPRR